MPDSAIPFEKMLQEIETRLDKAGSEEERRAVAEEVREEQDRLFADISPWQRVQLARHPKRPRMLDFTGRVFEDFIELHGDRALGDDPAMVCGLARFRGQTVFVVGQQKGINTDEKVLRNWGMPHPEGYRKALRMFRLAERLGHPVVTFVDTPAAHPGIEAEEHGQGHAIAQNLLVASGLKTPILTIVLSEGGSGGALAIAVADWVAMFEYAVYMICPPERCAEILWRDAEKKDQAAAALRVTASDLLELGAIDRVLPEPRGGAHRDPDAAAALVAEEIAEFLAACSEGRWSLDARQARIRKMGQWLEAGHAPG